MIDTIVALATPPGVGGIAVIRLSGPQAFQVARSLHDQAGQAELRPRELMLGRAKVGEQVIDQALVVAMPAPNSYTGEDVVELQLHGSTAVVEQLLAAACANGARIAEPGEFTKRAYLNGKLDLVQAEAVAEVIAATTTAAARQAELKASGTVSQQINQLRRQIVAVVAELSANLDFGEEDLPDTDLDQTRITLEGLHDQIQTWLAGTKTAAVIKDGLQVAIVGLPNAGKSSLLNALVGYDRAIVTDVAGTTRDTLEEQVTINGLGVVFVDTAGLRRTNNEIERQGVGRSQQASRQAGVILVAASADQDMTKLRHQVEELEVRAGTPLVAVQTKIDQTDTAIAWPFEPVATIATSAKTGAGLAELRETIYHLGVGTANLETATITSLRQITCLQNCARELEQAITAIMAGAPMDVVAGELTLAAEELGGLLGESVSKAVIDQIFRAFCIGK